MNKIISTQDRVFLANVGPSGSGKTELFFKKLSGNLTTLRFYTEKCNKHTSNWAELFIKKYANVNILNNLENCLLIIDDSCEEIYNDKEFVKVATAGRHKNINPIYIKHNIYQQSKWSRTIDLNTSQKILFKSARDFQQIEFLGKQLNLVNFLKHCCQLATEEPFEHLLIDLDPKTSDCLRYCSNITEPGPTVLYLPSDKAETTPLNNEREKKLSILKQMMHLHPKQLRKSVRNCESYVIRVQCECLHNVLLGRVGVKVRDLEKYRHIFERVLKKK